MFMIDPSKWNLSFVAAAKWTLGTSLALAVLSLVQIGVFGMNYGIDFSGGTMMEVRTDAPTDYGKLRRQLNGLDVGDVQVQQFGSPDTALLRIEQQAGGDAAQQEAVARIRAELGDSVTYRRIEVLGPTISDELLRDGLLATALAITAMLFYIWMRFEWQFAVCAVVALAHDVLLTAGIFSLLQLEFNLATIAAGLTIIGYSMNDTVVVFDRIRDNLRRYKKIEYGEVIDRSLRSTLRRTIITSVSTLLALFALLLLGGPVIFGFALAMTLGVIFGTYSSLCIAAPLLLRVGERPGMDVEDAEETQR